MLLTKQVVQVQNICQWAVTTWTKSRGSCYVTVRVKLARYVCDSESKWKLLDEVENTICTCIKARKGNDPILHRVSNTVQNSILCNTGYCNLYLVHCFQVRDLYKKRKASSEQKKTQRSFCLRLVYISIRTKLKIQCKCNSLILNDNEIISCWIHFYPGFPKETLELKFRLLFFFFCSLANRSQVPKHAWATFWRMLDVLTDQHMAWCNGWRREVYTCKISTDTVYNTLKTHTNYAQSVRGRLTLKDVERFRNGSVSDPYWLRSFNSNSFL